jgi:4-hydroxy-tetrahydrodipicolinate synthase
MTMNVDWMRGCATALVTPFAADGSIDDAALTRLIDYQINNGVKLLVPCGTTGERATMT